MPEVKSYKPGQFSWTDLATTDVAAAKRAYSELFGWRTEEIPMPQGGAYTMANVGKGNVAGISAMMPDQKKAGMPPQWTVYFTVAKVDDSVKKATGLGAKVLAPAMDVMDVGRMAVLTDPSGASFAIWQAKKSIGSQVTGEEGSIAWAELWTRNVDACGSFYSKLFGWGASVQDMGNMKYTMFAEGKDQRAGMMPMMPDVPANVPSHWVVYFTVKNCDATAKKADSLKFKALVPPTDIPKMGRFAILSDPQGAAFGIFQSTR